MNLSAELDRWLAPEMHRLLLRIASRAADCGSRAFLVGGPVRDLMLGRSCLDMDVVLEGDALAIARAVTVPGERAPVSHPEFGTATLHCGAAHVDLVTARAERYERPGALPTVRPGGIEDDLARRDFTLNAMALELTGSRPGEVLDPHGGRDDLSHGLVRVLHQGSFVDDATRMLRGVRYEQRFGFVFEPRTLDLLQRDRCCLDTISGDRLRHELERTFEEEEPEAALQRLDTLRLLGAIRPDLRFEAEKAKAMALARRERPSGSQWCAVCWCLLAWGLDASGIEALRVRLNLRRSVSNDISDALALTQLEPRLDRPGMRPSEISDLLQERSHAALAVAQLLFKWPAARESVSLYRSRLRHVRPALTGSDLLRLGFCGGPEVGWALSVLRSARLNGEVFSRQDEVELALRLLAGQER